MYAFFQYEYVTLYKICSRRLSDREHHSVPKRAEHARKDSGNGHERAERLIPPKDARRSHWFTLCHDSGNPCQALKTREEHKKRSCDEQADSFWDCTRASVKAREATSFCSSRWRETDEAWASSLTCIRRSLQHIGLPPQMALARLDGHIGSPVCLRIVQHSDPFCVTRSMSSHLLQRPEEQAIRSLPSAAQVPGLAPDQPLDRCDIGARDLDEQG